MDTRLEILLQIQDLKAQKRELEEGAPTRQVQEEEFGLDVETAIRQLDDKIVELENELDPATRDRYMRLERASSRGIVPAINGICYGCFVSVPTSLASDPREQGLATCDHCGRFLYFVP